MGEITINVKSLKGDLYTFRVPLSITVTGLAKLVEEKVRRPILPQLYVSSFPDRIWMAKRIQLWSHWEQYMDHLFL